MARSWERKKEALLSLKGAFWGKQTAVFIGFLDFKYFPATNFFVYLDICMYPNRIVYQLKCTNRGPVLRFLLVHGCKPKGPIDSPLCMRLFVCASQIILGTI